jgi:hypothetical protein
MVTRSLMGPVTAVTEWSLRTLTTTRGCPFYREAGEG